MELDLHAKQWGFGCRTSGLVEAVSGDDDIDIVEGQHIRRNLAPPQPHHTCMCCTRLSRRTMSHPPSHTHTVETHIHVHTYMCHVGLRGLDEVKAHDVGLATQQLAQIAQRLGAAVEPQIRHPACMSATVWMHVRTWQRRFIYVGMWVSCGSIIIIIIITAISNIAWSFAVRTYAGTVVNPANLDALKRRSPLII